MKNWKCILGIHQYDKIFTQKAKNLVGGFSMIPIMRNVKKCKDCGKIHIDAYDIATSVKKALSSIK